MLIVQIVLAYIVSRWMSYVLPALVSFGLRDSLCILYITCIHLLHALQRDIQKRQDFQCFRLYICHWY